MPETKHLQARKKLVAFDKEKLREIERKLPFHYDDRVTITKDDLGFLVQRLSYYISAFEEQTKNSGEGLSNKKRDIIDNLVHAAFSTLSHDSVIIGDFEPGTDPEAIWVRGILRKEFAKIIRRG
jgi:hypothetical protein